jgi:hypothetical protein
VGSHCVIFFKQLFFRARSIEISRLVRTDNVLTLIDIAYKIETKRVKFRRKVWVRVIKGIVLNLSDFDRGEEKFELRSFSSRPSGWTSLEIDKQDAETESKHRKGYNTNC